MMWLLCVPLEDELHVVARFVVRRNLVAVLHYRTLAGVVSCQRKVHATVEHLQQIFQIARAALDVLRDVVRICHTVSRSSAGHELHQSLRSFITRRARNKARLLRHQAVNQIRIDAVLRTVRPNETVDFAVTCGPRNVGYAQP